MDTRRTTEEMLTGTSYIEFKYQFRVHRIHIPDKVVSFADMEKHIRQLVKESDELNYSARICCNRDLFNIDPEAERIQPLKITLREVVVYNVINPDPDSRRHTKTILYKPSTVQLYKHLMMVEGKYCLSFHVVKDEDETRNDSGSGSGSGSGSDHGTEIDDISDSSIGQVIRNGFDPVRHISPNILNMYFVKV